MKRLTIRMKQNVDINMILFIVRWDTAVPRSPTGIASNPDVEDVFYVMVSCNILQYFLQQFQVNGVDGKQPVGIGSH